MAEAVGAVASGKAFDSTTGDWTKLVEYKARNRQEAEDWCRFNRDWLKDLKVEER